MRGGRADPLGELDLSDFRPTPPRAAAAQGAVRAVSEAHDFPSRAAEAARAPARRRRTGRNVQLNIKATAQTIARFTALADARGLAFGELLERLVEAADRQG